MSDPIFTTLSEKCNPGDLVYCFEKDMGGCIQQICAKTAPEGETGWTQIGGPYPCENGCLNCNQPGTCTGYSEWRIVDGDGYEYAKGSITMGSVWVGYEAYGQILNDFPSAFQPLFYGSTGEKNFKIEAKCGSTWHDLEVYWNGTIAVCGSLADRYPLQAFNNTGISNLQAPCDVQRNSEGDPVCSSYGSYTEPCPTLWYSFPEGNGQAWRSPQPGPAYKFTGAVDGEWTNLNNWEDSAGLSPASSLPGESANIVIAGNLATKPTDLTINLGSVNVTSGGFISITMSCSDLYCEGSVQDGSVCPLGVGEYGGQVTCSNSCVFDNGGYLNGILYLTNNTIAEFKNGSFVGGVGSVNGESKFTQNSYNNGTLYGQAKFYDTSHHDGHLESSAVTAYFYNTSYNNEGNIYCNAEFYNSSYSSGTGEFSWVEYYDTSFNTGTVRSDNNVFFNEDSYNKGTITGEQYGPAECSFFGNSINKSTGIVSSRNSLSIEGKNQGSITITEAGHYVYVKGSGMNDTTGTITANTIFENVGGNIPRNKGTITGTADFTSGGCNDGGTATTFIPDPPPVC